MYRIFVFILTLLTSFSTFAQTDQLITLKGDTLIGKTSVSSNKSTAVQTVSIKIGKDKQYFKVYEIKSLIRGEDNYYTIKVNGIYQLGLLVKEGYLSIYKIMDSEVATSSAFEIAILIKKDGSQLVVPNLVFKKHMSIFLSDCKRVAKGFDDKTYKRSNLEIIVDDYNACIEENEKRAKPLKIVAKKDANPDKVALVEILIQEIKADGNLPEMETVIDMLNDLAEKMKTDVKIPSYLDNALRDSLKSKSDFLAKLEEILE